jgi:molybdopterin synthase sulfur carrier subunit
MNVRLLYFAWVRERIGLGEEEVELGQPITLDALVAMLRERSAGHAAAFADLSRLRAAINQDFVGWEAVAKPGDEVALFPPVTGG